MPFKQHGDLRYFTFNNLTSVGISHGIFTRRGGVSQSPWESLNVGGGVGDDRERVIQNRLTIFNALNRHEESIFDAWQVHSANVIFAEAPRPKNEPYQHADILITDKPEITLFMRFADCVPILMVDSRRGIVCLAHAGWIGTVKNVAAVAAAAIQARFGSRPADLLAAIGPSICVDHYPVGPEVVSAVRQAYGYDADSLLTPRGQATHFDLWAANHLSLQRAGVENIEIAGLCTGENLEDWFSHRGEMGKTGRFGAIISLDGRIN